MPYVQFESVDDFIPEPRCSKFAVGLQTRGREMGCTRGSVGSDQKGCGQNLVVLRLWGVDVDLRNSGLEEVRPLRRRERVPFYR